MTKKQISISTVALSVAAVGVAFVVACTEDNTLVSGPHGSSSIVPSRESSDSVYSEERPFWNLAQDLPSSAGFFIDAGTGNVVVSFTKPSEGEAARSQLRSRLDWVLALARAKNPRPDVIVRPVQYTFLQLRRWRDLMNHAVFQPGVAWLGPDWIKNRVVFGITPGTDPGPIRALARKLDIPQDAIDFEASGPYKPQSSLRDSIRPIAGGTQLAYLDKTDNTVYDCTLGFPALWNGERAFVTAQHCSSYEDIIDSTQEYQPKWPVTHADSMNISPIGFKVADYKEACPDTIPETVCSNADAAIWKFTLDTTPSNWLLGRIARPTYGCSPGPCSPVNFQIGSYFTINATQASVPLGALVSMVGRTDGWTQDYVTKLCQTVNITANTGATRALECQDFASYGSGDGDSGAPILMNIGLPSDSTVTLAGIHSGRTARGKDYAIFSPWSGIAKDYPGLIVH